MLLSLLLYILTLNTSAHQSFEQVVWQDSIHVEVYKTFDDFEKAILLPESDSLYVVNFWATWCVPCIKELPYFEELAENHKNEAFKLILVSIDFSGQLETKIKPLLRKKNIRSKVVHLEDMKYNKWIDRVDPRWSGAIPITLVIRGNQRLFFEQEFENTQALENIIQPLISD